MTYSAALARGKHKYGAILQYIVPTVMIVLLAEILPQSVCNRFGLRLAAKTRHITLLLFIVCAPIAWPLSKVVDYILGREVREIYSEEQLKTLIKVQSKKMEEAAQGGRLLHSGKDSGFSQENSARYDDADGRCIRTQR
ncbi:hypothetical protein ANCDUO_10220 [Ancylostoma duodenale]|uniref:CNNM transmembrane domain-containing protein n=1 Tax=Ancylostoma duodenale TaxID=51022 RepID=A0A0C2GRD0_9BILA|nr:hypothetical protein ANCDUO_10220 [Ancylostoma duodenale]